MSHRFDAVDFQTYLAPEYTAELDALFLEKLNSVHPEAYRDLCRYRQNQSALNPLQVSELVITGAKVLEDFLVDFFYIHEAVEKAQAQTLKQDPIFAFKKWIVLRRAKRRLLRDDALPPFNELHTWLETQINFSSEDPELAVATFAVGLLADSETHQAAIDKLTDWALHALKTPEARKLVAGWVSFSLPARTDYKRLIPLIRVTDNPKTQRAPEAQQRRRDGFDLTDARMSEREVLAEIDYCIYCHDHDGDFCSKGFPVKKGDAAAGFRKNPLDNTLTGCPLDEKISEMHVLKKIGHAIAALAAIMIDNPMCPATGHRICNDCMKGCIYQKQQPVNIPQIETGVLSDVLALPYGVEIYDLLTRFNPLRPDQPTAKSYNGRKVFIAGLGPAGFTLAHHLLMAGCAVVATDGLKLEPLPDAYIKHPIRDYATITERLSDRVMTGFGGVAEYGITVRWDKNFLKLIYISLMRRPYFQAFDGVRFGGTVTVESLYAQAFHHIAIAVGAGLPRALPVPNSMARGMRQANDFLMTLQLTGAAQSASLSNLQVRLPALIIGGGLTGVDTATEVQAYYIAQIEKTLMRYETLCQTSGTDTVRAAFDEESLMILDEFLSHAAEARQERERAARSHETPHFTPLLEKWGGVKILYRRNLETSPAYLSNHEELEKALEEGLSYLEGLQPKEVLTDHYGHVRALVCEQQIETEDGAWEKSEITITLPAKSIFVATGASPNVAYDFEHQNIFKRTHMQYETFEIDARNQLTPVKPGEQVKSDHFGPFTSYQDAEGRTVTFLGDVHPTFAGNVVRAIASAKRTYPKILSHLAALQQPTSTDYPAFKANMSAHFDAEVVSVSRLADNVISLCIKAPAAVCAFQPGQFYRLQNYHHTAMMRNHTRLQLEPLALLGSEVDREKQTIRFLVVESGVSTRLCAHLSPGEKVSLMGPTGVRTKIPATHETILIIANMVGVAYTLSVAPALKAAGNRVIFVGYNPEKILREEIDALCDETYHDTENTVIDRLKDHVALETIDRITVFGHANFLRQFQHARHHALRNRFKKTIKIFGTVHNNMQCMMKGVCAQCLQWQIDPETGLRKKAVFACSWQDQPLELIDFDNYAERVLQNKMSETLSHLWLDAILKDE